MSLPLKKQLARDISHPAVKPKLVKSPSTGRKAAIPDVTSPPQLYVIGEPPRPTTTAFKTKAQFRDQVSDEQFESEYKLGEELGKGSFGLVKQATHIPSGELLAIKILPNNKKSESHTARWRQEAQLLRKLDHANIVKLLDIVETKSSIYLVMELMNAGELMASVRRKGKYKESDARQIVKLIIDAVGYLHGRGIVHRDLKPENILLNETEYGPQIKLADFGLSLVIDEFSMIRSKAGTPLYMAPEVIKGRAYSDLADMWSVGVITYLLYTNSSADEESLTQLICAGEITFKEKGWSGISDKAKDLIQRLLRINPTERYDAKEALSHPWITGGETQSMDTVLEMMRSFNAERKFRKAVIALMAANRFRYFGSLRTRKHFTTASPPHFQQSLAAPASGVRSRSVSPSGERTPGELRSAATSPFLKPTPAGRPLTSSLKGGRERVETGTHAKGRLKRNESGVASSSSRLTIRDDTHTLDSKKLPHLDRQDSDDRSIGSGALSSQSSATNSRRSSSDSHPSRLPRSRLFHSDENGTFIRQDTDTSIASAEVERINERTGKRETQSMVDRFNERQRLDRSTHSDPRSDIPDRRHKLSDDMATPYSDSVLPQVQEKKKTKGALPRYAMPTLSQPAVMHHKHRRPSALEPLISLASSAISFDSPSQGAATTRERESSPEKKSGIGKYVQLPNIVQPQ